MQYISSKFFSRRRYVISAVKVSSRGPKLYLGCLFLGGFAESRKAPISFVMFVCPFVCLSVCLCFTYLHISARILLDGFSLNLVVSALIKIC